MAPVVLLTLVTFTACDGNSGSREGSLLEPGIDPTGFDTVDLTAFAFEDAVMALEEATLDEPADFAPDLTSGRSRGQGPNIGGLLRTLHLDRDQRIAILRAVFDSHTCLRGALEQFREVNREILDNANDQRRAIIDAWTAGEIDRDEARARLRELNEATRAAIRNNPANEPIREQLCDCRLELFAAIRTVLDTDQQQVWDEWIAGHDRDCVTP